MPPRKRRAAAEGSSDEEDEKPMVSQKSQKPVKKTAPAPATADSASEGEAGDAVAATQGTITATEKKFSALTPDEQERKVAEVVRLILFAASGGVPVSQAVIAKSLKELSAAAAAIIKRAKLTLEQVFGLTLIELRATEDKKEPPVTFDKFDTLKMTKTYVLRNIVKVPNPDELTHLIPSGAPHNALVMILLSVIYMNNGQTEKKVLLNFLKNIGIDLKNWHANEGCIEEYMDKTLVKEKFLQKIKTTDTEGDVFEYRWGARARAVLTEQDIISFIAQVYGDKPSVWLDRLGKAAAPAAMGPGGGQAASAAAAAKP